MEWRNSLQVFKRWGRFFVIFLYLTCFFFFFFFFFLDVYLHPFQEQKLVCGGVGVRRCCMCM
jgi:hypothetical protein